MIDRLRIAAKEAALERVSELAVRPIGVWIVAFRQSAMRYPEFRWDARLPLEPGERGLYLHGATVLPHPTTRELLNVSKLVEPMADVPVVEVRWLMDGVVDEMAAVLRRGA